MSWQLAMLIATAVLAIVALTAAIVAVSALRQMRTLREAPEPAEIDVWPAQDGVSLAERPSQREVEPVVARVVEGRVIVQPTQEQVVAATMTRPAIRLGIFAAGLAHALRPESRDRIVALMRREFRGRRRARQRAARVAAKATNAPPNANQGWVGS